MPLAFAKPPNRQIAFDIAGLKDGQWRPLARLDDGDEALAHARKLLGAPGFDRIRLVRQRVAPNGFEMETEILNEPARARPEARAVMVADPDIVPPVCGDLAALTAYPARMAIGQLYRAFLKHHQITQTELLHGWGWMKKLDAQGQSVAAGTRKVAALQARLSGETPAEAVVRLEALLADLAERARAFGAGRRALPSFDAADPASVRAALARKVPAEDAAWSFMALLTTYLTGLPSLDARLDELIVMAIATRDELVRAAIDAPIADALSAAACCRELVPPQPNRAAFLGVLGDLLAGRPLAESPHALRLSRLDTLLRAAPMPQARRALLDRIVRELNAAQPLDPKLGGLDDSLLEPLLKRLKTDDGVWIGGADMAEAVNRHRVGHHHRVLCHQGQHEAAAALARRWRIAAVPLD